MDLLHIQLDCGTEEGYCCETQNIKRQRENESSQAVELIDHDVAQETTNHFQTQAHLGLFRVDLVPPLDVREDQLDFPVTSARRIPLHRLRAMGVAITVGAFRIMDRYKI